MSPRNASRRSWCVLILSVAPLCHRDPPAALLEKLSALLPSARDRRVFFINNYDQVLPRGRQSCHGLTRSPCLLTLSALSQILSVFQERGIMCEEVQRFEDLLLQQRELFAEEEITQAFPRLIGFVQRTEQQLLGGGNSAEARGGVDEALIETLVREFAANWRSGIQQINEDVLKYFADFRNGTEILKQVLTQLLLYYTRFQDIIKKVFTRPPAFSRDVVSTATILLEIKRYSRTF